MYEEMTYENILQRCLNRVTNDIDKRQGSIIYDALAPACAELAQMYAELSFLEDRTYADTAQADDLTRRAAERGIIRKLASKAIRKGIFNINIPLGSRFSIEDVNYLVIDKITDKEFRLGCETAGDIGNRYTGQLIPVEYINGLETAILTDILIPGDNEESDESLRKRYFDTLESQAFGGNIADYKEKTNNLVGVGGTKVYPVWNGGGTVKLVIIDSSFNKPSNTLIEQVQTEIDPLQNQGEGLGLAPIGHKVTVTGVNEVTVNIETSLTFQSDYTWIDVKQSVESAINDYLLDLRKVWSTSDNLVVRISQLETRILNVPGVLDIQSTKLNGIAQNLALTDVEVPIIGEVIAV